MLETIIIIFTALIIIFFPYHYWKKHQNHLNKSRRKHEDNINAGIGEPVTLHPRIDPNQCIQTGACLDACPEGDILGIVDGRAQIVSPTRCIGHGACQKACPTDAISLIFGTATRGVEIPNVKETFESNVKGVYIAGELGGMGLIRNAITQGKEAVEYISKSLNGNRNGRLDLVIIGAGPAGIAASLQAKKEGLNYITVEQEDIFGGTILSFPRQKIVMTQPMQIPMYGKFSKYEIQKEELLTLLHDVIEQNEIKINFAEKVESIEQDDNIYTIVTSKNKYQSRKVLLTIGRRGTPRKLGVIGEHSSKVTYNLLEPEQYRNRHILVVGGGDSAVEAAAALSEQDGTTVTLSYRKDAFNRIKEKNREKIEALAQAGMVDIYFNSQVESIQPDNVIIRIDVKNIIIPNDYVFVFIGGELPVKLLNGIGISMEMKYGEQ
ncbi:MAG: NAD(P)-binding domain-containing protein [bacterium]